MDVYCLYFRFAMKGEVQIAEQRVQHLECEYRCVVCISGLPSREKCRLLSRGCSIKSVNIDVLSVFQICHEERSADC